jgi:hypothetical protein
MEFIIVVFEGLHDYVAIVPRGCWLRSRGTCYWHRLDGGVPPWYHPLMVAIHPNEDLRNACETMNHAETDWSTFQNLTASTMVQYHGSRSTSAIASDSFYSPDSSTMATAILDYVRVWRRIYEKGFRMRLHPAADNERLLVEGIDLTRCVVNSKHTLLDQLRMVVDTLGPVPVPTAGLEGQNRHSNIAPYYLDFVVPHELLKGLRLELIAYESPRDRGCELTSFPSSCLKCGLIASADFRRTLRNIADKDDTNRFKRLCNTDDGVDTNRKKTRTQCIARGSVLFERDPWTD